MNIDKLHTFKNRCSKYLWVLATFFACRLLGQQQIANYITNGGLEAYYSCGNTIVHAKGWRSIDSSYFSGVMYNSYCVPNLPFNGLSYQTPRNGNGMGFTTFLCQPPQCPQNNRGYYRNRLKASLVAGKTYCVKFYVNPSNPTSYAISTIGAFFVDNTIDTITKIALPLSYINPQVENPITNFVTDTMGWTLISGTFVANGTEKNCLIGNFKSDVNTNKVLINSSILPTIGCDMYIDDVSCIPTDLPAYAGADIWAIPSQTVYIGRVQDVGIDEACTWYNLSNTVTPIANAAGLTLTVALSTQTYIVKQDICGIVKYDTVIVHASGSGNAELHYLTDNLKLYPQPASGVLTIETAVTEAGLFKQVSLCNALGQVIREEELNLSNGKKQLDISDLADGFYTLQFSTTKGYTLKKSLVVSR